MRTKSVKIRTAHVTSQHDYRFQDIVDCGDEVRKVYACDCGAQMVEVYLLLETRWVNDKEHHAKAATDDQR
ncbi:hypothetical protein OMAG_002469 [Candidatus Omnitrophus magneticus]|uniref:Uncharacterized protein n=1 Tax=Candidatus Omnitrophus magneticus TaxID=1609969 RepID=A0A0F0CQG8_9BACT|nr:hypothetical protein OMAG_002469 [Candidatus Omnitrophus magneticus]